MTLSLRCSKNAVGVIPVEVEVLGNRDALVYLPFGAAVYEIAQCIQGPGKWRDQDIEVGCVMSTRSHLLAIHKEQEELRKQREELEKQCSELETAAAGVPTNLGTREISCQFAGC